MHVDAAFRNTDIHLDDSSMRAQLERRLVELKSQFESGCRLLRDLEARQANLKNSLLRISGAIEVLEEELRKGPPSLGNVLEPGECASAGIEQLPQGSAKKAG
jgi:hypothetical protein